MATRTRWRRRSRAFHLAGGELRSVGRRPSGVPTAGVDTFSAELCGFGEQPIKSLVDLHGAPRENRNKLGAMARAGFGGCPNIGCLEPLADAMGIGEQECPPE